MADPSLKYEYIYINVWAPFLMKSCKTPAPQDNYEFNNFSFYEKSPVTRKLDKENTSSPTSYINTACT